jgi:hypothetical protein
MIDQIIIRKFLKSESYSLSSDFILISYKTRSDRVWKHDLCEKYERNKQYHQKGEPPLDYENEEEYNEYDQDYDYQDYQYEDEKQYSKKPGILIFINSFTKLGKRKTQK